MRSNEPPSRLRSCQSAATTDPKTPSSTARLGVCDQAYRAKYTARLHPRTTTGIDEWGRNGFGHKVPPVDGRCRRTSRLQFIRSSPRFPVHIDRPLSYRPGMEEENRETRIGWSIDDDEDEDELVKRVSMQLPRSTVSDAPAQTRLSIPRNVAGIGQSVTVTPFCLHHALSIHCCCCCCCCYHCCRPSVP